MSLEKNIERIADALEVLVKQRLGLEEGRSEPTITPVQEPPSTTFVSRGKSEPPAPSTTAVKSAGRTGDDAPGGTTTLVDSTGRIWDERIDSSNHKFNADGKWAKRRGVDDDTRMVVLSELEGDVAQANINRITESFDGSKQVVAGPTAEVTTNQATPQVVADFPKTLQEMQLAAQDIVRDLGPRATEVGALLAEFGTANLTGLNPHHYEGFYARLKGLLG